MKAMLSALSCAALAAAIVVTMSQPQAVIGAASPAIAPLGAQAGAKAGDPVKGQKIFTLQKCTTCHGVNDKAKKFGPDLGAVGSRRDAAWLAKYLVNPTPLDPKNPPIVKMTPVSVKGPDLDNLIAYLVTLKAPK